MTTLCNLYPLLSMLWIALLVIAAAAGAVGELRRHR